MSLKFPNLTLTVVIQWISEAGFIAVFYSLLSTVPPHAGMNSQVRHLITVIIKHTGCVYRQSSIILGVEDTDRLRLPTKPTEYLSDKSAVCIYNSQSHTGITLCLACCCDTVGCCISQLRGVVAMWLLAVRTLRRHSRSNIKSDSSNHPPYTPRESVIHCVCVRPSMCVEVNRHVSSVLFVLDSAWGQYAPLSPPIFLPVSRYVCVSVSVWAYLNEIWQWIVTISEGASCRG